jgi:hypothetical protein
VIEESFDGCFLAFIVVWVIWDQAHKTTCWGLVGCLAGELREHVLRTSPIPIKLAIAVIRCLCSLTWTAKDADQFRGASAVVTDRNYVAEWAPLVFSHSLEDVDQIVCSASTGEDNNTFGFDRAIGGRGCGAASGVWIEVDISCSHVDD